MAYLIGAFFGMGLLAFVSYVNAIGHEKEGKNNDRRNNKENH